MWLKDLVGNYVSYLSHCCLVHLEYGPRFSAQLQDYRCGDYFDDCLAAFPELALYVVPTDAEGGARCVCMASCRGTSATQADVPMRLLLNTTEKRFVCNNSFSFSRCLFGQTPGDGRVQVIRCSFALIVYAAFCRCLWHAMSWHARPLCAIA